MDFYRLAIIKPVQSLAQRIGFRMVTPNMIEPMKLAKSGVARISYGPTPYFQMIEALKREAIIAHMPLK